MRKSTLAVHLVAWLVALAWLIPFLGIFMSSIRPFSEIIEGWWNFREFNPTAKNYLKAWSHPQAPVSRSIVNSAIIAIPATLTPIFVGSLAAYSFARFSYRMRDMLFLTIVLVQALPAQSVIIPLFDMLADLQLYNTFQGIILVHTAFALPWIIFFLRNFFATLPFEVEEAARIDGASDLQIYFKIVLPMSLPAIASVAALQFMWVWNDFFFALVLLTKRDIIPLTVGIIIIKGRYFIDWGLVSAASIITISIPVMVYAALQKYYVKGVVAGAVRG